MTKRKLRLKDLVMNTDWPDIEQFIVENREDDEEMKNDPKYLIGYGRVYKQLRRLKPKRNMMTLVIEIREDEDWDGITKKYEDVYGTNHRDNENYALDYTRWEEWLGMFVNTDTLANYTYENIIVDCIWEMTFHGWTQGKVKKGLDRLNRICKKPGKGIPWEEVKKNLNIDESEE